MQAGLCTKTSGRVLRRPSPERCCRAVLMLRFPTCFPSFRVVGEKQLPQEIVFLVWSPKRDLIALANTTGEVSEPARSPSCLEPQFPLLQTWRIRCLPCPYSSPWQLALSGSVKDRICQTWFMFPFPVWQEQMPSKVLHTQVSVD